MVMAIVAFLTGILIYRAVYLRPLSPDRLPTNREENQIPLPTQDPDDTNDASGQSITVTYDPQVRVDLSDLTVLLYYAHPNDSLQDVSVMVMVQEETLASSDWIEPGHAISQLELSPHAAARLQEGSYRGYLLVRACDPETSVLAPVDAKAEVTVIVEK